MQRYDSKLMHKIHYIYIYIILIYCDESRANLWLIRLKQSSCSCRCVYRLCTELVCISYVLSVPPPSAGTPLPPGTPAIPLSQLQQHSLTLQGQHGQTLAAAQQPQQGQQAVFRFPAAVSLTGDLLCLLPHLCLLWLIIITLDAAAANANAWQLLPLLILSSPLLSFTHCYCSRCSSSGCLKTHLLLVAFSVIVFRSRRSSAAPGHPGPPQHPVL